MGMRNRQPMLSRGLESKKNKMKKKVGSLSLKFNMGIGIQNLIVTYIFKFEMNSRAFPKPI